MTTDTPTMMTITAYARHAGLGINYTRRLCNISDFPALRAGIKWLIHAEAADKWLADRAFQGVSLVP